MSTEKTDLIKQYLSTSGSRQKLAQLMAEPLRQRLSEQAIGRKIFPVEELPVSSEPIYMAIDEPLEDPLFGPEDMFPRGKTGDESE